MILGELDVVLTTVLSWDLESCLNTARQIGAPGIAGRTFDGPSLSPGARTVLPPSHGAAESSELSPSTDHASHCALVGTRRRSIPNVG